MDDQVRLVFMKGCSYSIKIRQIKILPCEASNLPALSMGGSGADEITSNQSIRTGDPCQCHDRKSAASVDEPLGQSFIGIDPAIAQERPMCAGGIHFGK